MKEDHNDVIVKFIWKNIKISQEELDINTSSL